MSNPVFGGFSTASGKTVTVSAEALKKAKALLKTIEEEEPEQPLPSLPDVGGVWVSQEGLSNTFVEMDCSIMSNPVFGGFSTASGKSVSVSAEALKKAKALLKTIEEEEPEQHPLSSSDRGGVWVSQEGLSNTVVDMDHCSIMSNPVFGGFSTASGKSVSVSAEALEKAKVLLRKIEEEEPEQPPLSSSNGGGVWISQEEVSNTVVDMDHCSVMSNPVFGGFSTASGKNVSVSAEALEKAKALLRTSEEEEPEQPPPSSSDGGGVWPSQEELSNTFVEMDHGPVTQEVIESTLALLEDEDKHPFDSTRGFDDDDPSVFRIIIGNPFPDSKTIPLIRVVIARLYPVLFMLKQPGRKSTFETLRSCELAVQQSRKAYDERMNKLMEKMEMEVQENLAKRKTPKSRLSNSMYTKEQLEEKDPLDLLAWVENCSDNETIRFMLSERKLRQLEEARMEEYRRVKAAVSSKYEPEMTELQKQYPTTVRLLKVRLVDVTATRDMLKNPANSALLSVWQAPEESQEMFVEGTAFEMKNIVPLKQFSNQIRLNLTRGSGVKLYEKYDRSFAQFFKREATSFSVMFEEDFSPWFGEVDTVGLVVYVAPFIPSVGQTVYFADENQNILGVRFWSSLASHQLAKILEFGKLVVMKNLQWRAASRKSKIFEAFAQETSTFTNFAKPDDLVMKKAWCHLRDNVGVYTPDVQKFAQVCEMKAYSMLNNSTVTTPVSSTYTPNSSFVEQQVPESGPEHPDHMNPVKMVTSSKKPRLSSPPKLLSIPTYQLPMSGRVTKKFVIPRRSDANAK